MDSVDPLVTIIGASKLAVQMPDIVRRIRNGEAFALTSNGSPIATITPLGVEVIEPELTETERRFTVESQMAMRTGRTLARAGYPTISSIQAATDQELLDIRNVGEATLRSIRRITTQNESD
jgi:antitoxin (DNA-binding transcriptional repressor) of toxin-antitoxin stability system